MAISIRLTATAALLLFAGASLGEALIKPLPQPGLDRLAESQRIALSASRQDFDKARTALVGERLAEAYVQIGAEYARYGFPDVALAAIENAIALSPEDGRFWYLRGHLRVVAKQTALARADLEQAAKLDTEYMPIRVRLADVQMSLGDLPAARKTLQALAKERPDFAPAWAGLGEVDMRQRLFPDAVTNFRKALALDPQATLLQGRLAEALAGTNDTLGAAEARAKAGDEPPAYSDPLVAGFYAPVSAGDVVELAEELLVAGNVDRAAVMLDQFLSAHPDDLGARALYVRVELARGDATAAERRAEDALKLAPNSGLALLMRGLVFEAREQDDDAQSWYARAVAAEPGLDDARIMLGNAHMRKQRGAQAYEQFRTLHRNRPEDPIALARFVAAASISGHCADAIATAAARVAAQPKDGIAAQVLVRATASCGTATGAQQSEAVRIAKALYDQRPEFEHAEALAMIYAVTGKSKDAVELEAQAMFSTVKVDDQVLLAGQREWLKRFQAGQGVDRPWPPGHGFMSPPATRIAPK